jgi:hypothetical protein
MIIRAIGSSQFLITQPDHAALAAHIMRFWSADGLLDSPRRADILHAIEEHDNGWREVDAAPLVEETTGRILDFIHAPDEVKRGVWPRAVERLRATPYAAALVAQHAIHVYARNRTSSDWAAFFLEMEELRSRNLRQTPSALDELLRDYAFVRLGDLMSLTFCNGWTGPQTDEYGYAIRLTEARLSVSPDPFDGRPVPFEIAASELPDRPFRSAKEAQRALLTAPRIILTGLIIGSAAT